MTVTIAPLVVAHMVPALIAVPLGAWVLLGRKGSALHRMAGRVWAGLMLVVAITSLWITGLNAPHWSPIHILSLVVIAFVPIAIFRAWQGDIANHRRHMRNMYFGLLAAGAFAAMPGRTFGHLLWG